MRARSPEIGSGDEWPDSGQTHRDGPQPNNIISRETRDGDLGGLSETLGYVQETTPETQRKYCCIR